MTGWATRREVEWDDEQQGWMLALANRRANECNQCGGDLHETTSPDNDGSPGNGRYAPLLPIRCHRCTALARSEADYRKQKAEHPQALMHRVELRPARP